MRTYTNDQWLQLGRVVSRARRSAGLGDTNAWASKVGRSTRILLGLERGEAVGVGTLESVEKALEWYPGSTFEILEGVDPAQAISPDVGGLTQDAGKGYVSAPGAKADGGASDSEVLNAIREVQRELQRVSERLERLEGEGS